MVFDHSLYQLIILIILISVYLIAFPINIWELLIDQKVERRSETSD